MPLENKQDKIQTRYFLNAVDPVTQNVGNVTPGAWRIDDDQTAAGFLQRYADSIRVDGEIGDLGLIQSIPSVFARPLLFAQAISRKIKGDNDGSAIGITGPVHRAVRQEWRGLLATFAFAEYFRSYELDLVSYTIPELKDIPAKYDGLSGTNDNYFRIMLRTQLPKPESAWSAVNMIYCDKQLIGATSPWTVVYTPAEYNCPVSIPWVREVRRKKINGEEVSYRVFTDPVEYFKTKESRRELRILDLWLRDLLDELKTPVKWGYRDILADDTSADAWTASVKRELEAWRSEIPAAPLNERGPSFTVRPGHQYHTQNPYAFFLRTCELDAGTEDLSKSDILLHSRTGEELLLFSRKQGADPRLRVYGSVFGDQINVAKLDPPFVSGRWRTELGREIPIGYAVAEDVFFPRKLAEMPLGKKAIKCGSDRFALPLTSAFLEHFEARDLMPGGRVKFRVIQGARTITARLELPLTNGRFLAVERQYNTDDAEQVMMQPNAESVPAMAVWPDFEDPSWRSYIAVYVGGAQRDYPLQLTAAPISSVGRLHAATTLDGNQNSRRLWESTDSIAGFVLRQDGGEQREIGLVLADQRRLNPTIQDSSWKLSIDFGTSNTVIAHVAGDGSRRVLDLQGRACVLTDRIAADFETVITEDFYPTGPIIQPFITALKDQKEYTTLEGRLDYQLLTEVYPEQLELIVPNIKWGTLGGRPDEKPMKAFLEHLVRLVLAHARAERIHSVNLLWSYPLALPAAVKASMKSFWSTLSVAFCDPGIVRLKVESKGIPESDAICRQLNQSDPLIAKVQAREAISLMIDVGGGSTDIGVWSEGKLLDQISVKLAGSDILAPSLLRQAAFLEASKAAVGRELRVPTESNQTGKIGVFFNAAMMRASRSGPGGTEIHPLYQPLALAARKDPASDAWYGLRSMIYLHFAGVTYFAGLAVRRFLWDEAGGKDSDAPPPGDPKNAYLFYGGKAASLLAWLGEPEGVQKALQNIFTAGVTSPLAGKLGSVTAQSFVFGGGGLLPLKQEVAIGCLCDPIPSGADAAALVENEQGSDDLKTDPAARRRVILGEEQCKSESGENLDFFRKLTADEMLGVRLPSKQNSSSTLMTAFLDGAMRRFGADLNIDVDGLRDCKPQTDTIQQIIASATADGKILQPVFISELVGVMKAYAVHPKHQKI